MRQLFFVSPLLLIVSVLLGLTEVAIAEETRIYSAVIPVLGPDSSIECTILNASDKKTISGEIAMFAPTRFGTVPMGAGTFVDTGPEESSGIKAGLNDNHPTSVYCRITFNGKEKDVRANLTVYSAGVPIFTVPVE